MAETLHLDVQARRGDFRLAVRAEIPAIGSTAIFGPSGSGKTTLLRLIAGFERPDSGRIALGADVWCEGARHLPPHQRPVGLMFQDGRLFPHLDVAGNLRFAAARARARGPGPALAEVVEALALAPLLDRPVAALSGGEARRVALGRTLLTRPRLLLLDEPLAGLDRPRRREILPWLAGLPARWGLPVIHVSHEIEEVARLCDHVLLLSDGAVAGMGKAAEIVAQLPPDAFPDPAEAGDIVEAVVSSHDPALMLLTLDVPGGRLSVPARRAPPPGTRLRLRLRMRDLALALAPPAGTSIRNALPARLLALESRQDDPLVIARLDAGGTILRAHITRASVAELGLTPGLQLFVLVKAAALDGD